jgi:N-acetylglucosamine kinase-like BadF-type ATPase
MTQFFLGVDTGATKTHSLIADETGRVLGFGLAGPGNHEGVGYEGVELALKTSVSQALGMAGLATGQICGAGFGIAGYDWPSERQPTLETIATLGLSAPLEAVNDMVVGLIAGASQGWGVVIDAGTGTNCRGRTPDGREGMITGMGGLFGEYGGASDLVRAAVRAVAHEWSRRGPATRLSAEFLKLTGASNLTDLLEGLTLEKYHLRANLAPLVFKVAEEGDPVANEIIAWLGAELGESILAIVRQIDIARIQFEVVMIGSLFNGGRLLVEPMVKKVHSLAPGACFTRLHAPPVAGGVLLGMQQAGMDFRPIRERLLEETRRVMEKEGEKNGR